MHGGNEVESEAVQSAVEQGVQRVEQLGLQREDSGYEWQYVSDGTRKRLVAAGTS